MNEKIFKSYDVRGVYPSEIDESLAEAIGRAIVISLGAETIAVGVDNRASSPALMKALVRGITEQGANVTLLGLLSTPMLYFSSAKLPVDAAVMVTASHNPAQYNGFKICRKNAVPVGLSSGLAEIRDIALAKRFFKPVRTGTTEEKDIKKDYYHFIRGFADTDGKKFRIAVDAAHAMGVLELPIYDGLTDSFSLLYGTLEPPGTCPHEANPMRTETLEELSATVRDGKFDIGVAYDGDADRIGFVDELGKAVPMDLVTALLARALLARRPGATILFDLRSSKSVGEAIREGGGVARECKVGHANIKKQMIEEGALLAGEASGHYYFAEGGYIAEMGTLPAILLLDLMAKTGKPLSQLVAEVSKYAHSGELNFTVIDTQPLFAKMRERFADGTISELDGLKISYADWWFSLRASNTEPLIRLNAEADTKKILGEKLNILTEIINAK